MILEGTMISLAVIVLTVFHPGLCFQGYWQEVNFKLRGDKMGSSSSLPSETDGLHDIEKSRR